MISEEANMHPSNDIKNKIEAEGIEYVKGFSPSASDITAKNSTRYFDFEAGAIFGHSLSASARKYSSPLVSELLKEVEGDTIHELIESVLQAISNGTPPETIESLLKTNYSIKKLWEKK